MTGLLIVMLAVMGALANALRPPRSGELITHRPYNNRYSDASAARQDKAL